MRKFRLSRARLPEIKFEREYTLRDGKGRVAYYRAGEWSFSDLPDEDADPSDVMKAILANIAWYEFLVNGGLEAATAERRNNEPAQ